VIVANEKDTDIDDDDDDDDDEDDVKPAAQPAAAAAAAAAAPVIPKKFNTYADAIFGLGKDGISDAVKAAGYPVTIKNPKKTTIAKASPAKITSYLKALSRNDARLKVDALSKLPRKQKGFGNTDSGLLDDQIQEVMKKVPDFLGVWASDEIPKLLPKIHPHSRIADSKYRQTQSSRKSLGGSIS